MSADELAKLQAARTKSDAAMPHGSFGIGKGGSTARRRCSGPLSAFRWPGACGSRSSLTIGHDKTRPAGRALGFSRGRPIRTVMRFTLPPGRSRASGLGVNADRSALIVIVSAKIQCPRPAVSKSGGPFQCVVGDVEIQNIFFATAIIESFHERTSISSIGLEDRTDKGLNLFLPPSPFHRTQAATRR